MSTVSYVSFESVIGTLYIAGTEQGICKILLPGQYQESLLSCLQQSFGHIIHQETTLLGQAITELEQYFSQQRTEFTVPLHLMGTTFQKKVWNELINIPYGFTTTYGTIAKRIGNEKASRAVGGANNKNPIPIIIPCHRVIGVTGKLVGYAGGLEIKRKLLQLEGMQSERVL